MTHEPHELHKPSAGEAPERQALGRTKGLLLAAESFRIQGAVFEVNRTLGSGFLEAVYQECLDLEFRRQGIPFKAHPSLSIRYKDTLLSQRYVPDFVCFDRIIVELKVSQGVTWDHRAQVINYLKATGMRVGLLINFGCAPARIDRLVN